MYLYNGTIGNLAWYQGEKVMLGKSVAYITVENYDRTYIYTYLQTPKIHVHFVNSLTGSTIKNLGLRAIRETKILIPVKNKEQSKIGTFFKNLDHNLTLHQSKYDKLVNVKKAMLEKMFPKNGADVPEIRFKGFTEAWEEKKLVEFSNLIHGDGDWILSEDITSNGEYKIVQLGNIGLGKYTQKDLKTVSSKTFEMLKGTPIKKGDLLINRMVDGNVNSCIFELDGNYITSVDVCWIRENEYINNYFLMSLLTTVKSQRMLLNLSSGSGRIRISKKNLFEKFNFFLPTSDEQTKIGNFFKNLDKLLTIHKSELEKLKNIKKSMLEKMFV